MQAEAGLGCLLRQKVGPRKSLRPIQQIVTMGDSLPRAGNQARVQHYVPNAGREGRIGRHGKPPMAALNVG